MKTGLDSTYYDILEVSPSATQQQIQEAYLKARKVFQKDSMACYSLFDQDETQDLLRSLEDAYRVLSDPIRRRDYDLDHLARKIKGPSQRGSFMEQTTNEEKTASSPGLSKPADIAEVISIDRVPPMEAVGDDLLIPPNTEFVGPAYTNPAIHVPVAASPPVHTNPVPPESAPAPTIARIPALVDIQAMIEKETEWSGAFLRQVREARGIFIEDVARFTKINKNYLMAIENDDFNHLPAPVFLRGFLVQIARMYRLPPETVATAYMVRFFRVKPRAS